MSVAHKLTHEQVLRACGFDERASQVSVLLCVFNAHVCVQSAFVGQASEKLLYLNVMQHEMNAEAQK